jgi:hypothetical protein
MVLQKLQGRECQAGQIGHRNNYPSKSIPAQSDLGRMGG